jgi:hypothetical protein
MKKALMVIPALTFSVITWMSCANESPTSSSDVEAPASGRATTQNDSGVDPQNFSCANVEEVRVRFSDPGYIEENQVAVYAAFIGVPPGDKFLKIWWDYDNKREKYQIVDTQAGEVRRDNDLVYDVEAVVEHTYDGLTDPTEYNVRVELVLEGGSRGCARNRNITVAPPSAQRLVLVGHFAVSDGPHWTTNPPTYSCRQACALLFGGAASNYRCSVNPTSITGTAWADGYADTSHCGASGGTPVADNWKVGTNYNCGSAACSFSAYVSDHSCSSVNYCYR